MFPADAETRGRGSGPSRHSGRQRADGRGGRPLRLRIHQRRRPGGRLVGCRKVDLVVTNTGSAPCSLTGYPRVVFAASGVQIGRPVVESSRVAEATTVSLGPGASAVATLHIIDPSALTSCKEEDFTEIWVSLAAEDDTIGVDFSGKTCSNTTNANIDPYQAR